MFAGRGKWKGLLKGPSGLRPQDVFKTLVRTGQNSVYTANIGIDVATHGGLLWNKGRITNGVGYLAPNQLISTVRGTSSILRSDSTGAAYSAGAACFTPTSTGYTLPSGTTGGAGGAVNYYNNDNDQAGCYVDWFFRRAPKFFDVVTWTGNGVAGRTIAHNLGIAPGLVIVRCTSDADNGYAKHRSAGSNDVLLLDNTTSAYGDTTTFGTGFTFNSTTFQVGTTGANQSGRTYEGLLFAHDTSSDGIVQCGSFTTDGDGDATISGLPWAPQFVLTKRTDASSDWAILDTTRGWGAGSDAVLFANSSGAEFADQWGAPNSSGFTYARLPSATYIYMAIRANT